MRSRFNKKVSARHLTMLWLLVTRLSLYVMIIVSYYCLFRAELREIRRIVLSFFFAKYTVNTAMQVISIFIADVVNIDKLISKRMPYLVCRNLQSINFLGPLILGGSRGQQLELEPPSISILCNKG